MKIPRIFERLSSGSEAEKLRAYNYLIRKFSHDEDSYEATAAVNHLQQSRQLDGVLLAELVRDYHNAAGTELRVSVLKVLSWLFSRIWEAPPEGQAEAEGGAPLSAAGDATFTGPAAEAAMHLFVLALRSGHSRLVMPALFMLGQQDVPHLLMPRRPTFADPDAGAAEGADGCGERAQEKSAPLLVDVLRGLLVVCTGSGRGAASPGSQSQSQSQSHSQSQSQAGWTSQSQSHVLHSQQLQRGRGRGAGLPASWADRPLEAHQMLLTALLNVAHQSTRWDAAGAGDPDGGGGPGALNAFRAHFGGLGWFIARQYLLHPTAAVLRLYALQLLQVVYPTVEAALEHSGGCDGAPWGMSWGGGSDSAAVAVGGTDAADAVERHFPPFSGAQPSARANAVAAAMPPCFAKIIVLHTQAAMELIGDLVDSAPAPPLPLAGGSPGKRAAQGRTSGVTVTCPSAIADMQFTQRVLESLDAAQAAPSAMELWRFWVFMLPLPALLSSLRSDLAPGRSISAIMWPLEVAKKRFPPQTVSAPVHDQPGDGDPLHHQQQQRWVVARPFPSLQSSCFLLLTRCLVRSSPRTAPNPLPGGSSSSSSSSGSGSGPNPMSWPHWLSPTADSMARRLLKLLLGYLTFELQGLYAVAFAPERVQQASGAAPLPGGGVPSPRPVVALFDRVLQDTLAVDHGSGAATATTSTAPQKQQHPSSYVAPADPGAYAAEYGQWAKALAAQRRGCAVPAVSVDDNYTTSSALVPVPPADPEGLNGMEMDSDLGPQAEEPELHSGAYAVLCDLAQALLLLFRGAVEGGGEGEGLDALLQFRFPVNISGGGGGGGSCGASNPPVMVSVAQLRACVTTMCHLSLGQQQSARGDSGVAGGRPEPQAPVATSGSDGGEGTVEPFDNSTFVQRLRAADLSREREEEEQLGEGTRARKRQRQDAAGVKVAGAASVDAEEGKFTALLCALAAQLWLKPPEVAGQSNSKRTVHGHVVPCVAPSRAVCIAPHVLNTTFMTRLMATRELYDSVVALTPPAEGVQLAGAGADRQNPYSGSNQRRHKAAVEQATVRLTGVEDDAALLRRVEGLLKGHLQELWGAREALSLESVGVQGGRHAAVVQAVLGTVRAACVDVTAFERVWQRHRPRGSTCGGGATGVGVDGSLLLTYDDAVCHAHTSQLPAATAGPLPVPVVSNTLPAPVLALLGELYTTVLELWANLCLRRGMEASGILVCWLWWLLHHLSAHGESPSLTAIKRIAQVTQQAAADAHHKQEWTQLLREHCCGNWAGVALWVAAHTAVALGGLKPFATSLSELLSGTVGRSVLSLAETGALPGVLSLLPRVLAMHLRRAAPRPAHVAPNVAPPPICHAAQVLVRSWPGPEQTQLDPQRVSEDDVGEMSALHQVLGSLAHHATLLVNRVDRGGDAGGRGGDGDGVDEDATMYEPAPLGTLPSQRGEVSQGRRAAGIGTPTRPHPAAHSQSLLVHSLSQRPAHHLPPVPPPQPFYSSSTGEEAEGGATVLLPAVAPRVAAGVGSGVGPSALLSQHPQATSDAANPASQAGGGYAGECADGGFSGADGSLDDETRSSIASGLRDLLVLPLLLVHFSATEHLHCYLPHLRAPRQPSLSANPVDSSADPYAQLLLQWLQFESFYRPPGPLRSELVADLDAQLLCGPMRREYLLGSPSAQPASAAAEPWSLARSGVCSRCGAVSMESAVAVYAACNAWVRSIEATLQGTNAQPCQAPDAGHVQKLLACWAASLHVNGSLSVAVEVCGRELDYQAAALSESLRASREVEEERARVQALCDAGGGGDRGTRLAEALRDAKIILKADIDSWGSAESVAAVARMVDNTKQLVGLMFSSVASSGAKLSQTIVLTTATATKSAPLHLLSLAFDLLLRLLRLSGDIRRFRSHCAATSDVSPGGQSAGQRWDQLATTAVETCTAVLMEVPPCVWSSPEVAEVVKGFVDSAEESLGGDGDRRTQISACRAQLQELLRASEQPQ